MFPNMRYGYLWKSWKYEKRINSARPRWLCKRVNKFMWHVFLTLLFHPAMKNGRHRLVRILKELYQNKNSSFREKIWTSYWQTFTVVFFVRKRKKYRARSIICNINILIKRREKIVLYAFQCHSIDVLRGIRRYACDFVRIPREIC